MYGEWNFGFPEKSQSLLNLPNLKKTTIEINGEMFDLRTGEIVEYSRSLLMNEGTVVRNVVWKSPKGREVKATFKRLVSLADKNIMAIQIKVTPINFEGQIVFGILIGILTGLFRFFGTTTEGVSYAIILGNLVVPLIEKYTLLYKTKKAVVS